MEIGVAVPWLAEPRRLAALLRAAEDAGVQAFWTYDQGVAGDAFVQAGFLAAATSRALVCGGVVNPFTRHPVVLASGAATADRLSGGRFRLVMGIGWKPTVECVLGIRRERPYAGFRDGLGAVRRLLRGDAVTFEGAHFDLRNARIHIEPVNRDLPVYVAGGGRRVLAIAAGDADGFLADFGRADPAYLAWMRDRVRAARAPAFRLGVPLGLRVVEDHEAAFAQEKRALPWTLATTTTDPYFEIAGIDPDLRGRVRRALGIDGPDPYAAFLDPARLEEAAALISDELASRLVPHNALVGPVAGCVRRLRDLATAGAGFVLLHFPGRFEETLPAAAEIAAAFASRAV